MLFVVFAQAPQLHLPELLRIARLPENEMARERAGKRPADDAAAYAGEYEPGPVIEVKSRRKRFHREGPDDGHHRSEDGAEQPAVFRAHGRRAFLAPVRRVPRAAFMRTFDDLRRVIRF